MKVQLTRFWRFLSLLAINLVILASLLYMFEYYLRLTDPFLHLPFDSAYYRRYRDYYDNLLIPAAGDLTWGQSIVNNRFGFRDRNFEAPKPAGVCRIMVLGDSVTWGTGLANEERYTHLTETYLAKSFPERRFEVLNFGVSGVPTTVERDVLKDYKDLVNPDLVVVGFVYNDPQPKSQEYRVERDLFYKKYGDLLNQIGQGLFQAGLSHLAKTMRQAIDNFIVTAGLVPPWETGLQRTYEKDSVEWQAFRQALQDIRAMSEAMDLPAPIFAVLNTGVYLARPTDVQDVSEALPIYLRWYHQAEQSAAELGFTTYNHEQELVEQFRSDEIAINELDAHPSAKVHLIYAQKLFEIIAAYLDRGGLCRPTSLQAPQPAQATPLTQQRLMRVQLGDHIRFLGYAVDQPQVSRGGTLHLTFGWQALADIAASYRIRTYLLSADGRRWAEEETIPCQGRCSTVHWPAGMLAPPGSETIYWPLAADMLPLSLDWIFDQSHLEYRDDSKGAIKIVPLPLMAISSSGALIDQHEIALSSQLPPGEYTLRMRMDDPMAEASLPAYDEVAGNWLPEAEVVLGKIEVR